MDFKLFKTITRVGESIGNAISHSLSPNAPEVHRDPPMHEENSSTIVLSGSRSANFKTKPPGPRVRASTANLSAKLRVENILAGEGPQDALNLIDDDDDIPEAVVSHTLKVAVPSLAANTLKPRRQSRRAEQNQDFVEEDEIRHLGPRQRILPPADAVTVRVPVYEGPEMASKPKTKFASGGLRPMNNLNQPSRGKSQIQLQRPRDEQTSPIRRSNPRGFTPRASISTRDREADGSPPRKRQKTIIPPDSSRIQQPESIILDDDEEENDDNDADPLHKIETPNASRIGRVAQRLLDKQNPPRTHLDAASRQIRQSVAHSTDGAGFTKTARQQREREAARSSGIHYTVDTTPRNAIATLHPSRIQKLLTGRSTTPESPDILHNISTIVGELSPPAPRYPRFDVKSLVCKGLPGEDSSYYVEVCPQHLEVHYKNKNLSKDALLKLPYPKIRQCRMADEKDNTAILQLSLSGGVVLGNVCYFEFTSQKSPSDLLKYVDKHYPGLKVEIKSATWIQEALGGAYAMLNVMSAADREEAERRERLTGPMSHAPFCETVRPKSPATKRIRQLDPLDRAPGSVSRSNASTNGNSRERRTTHGQIGAINDEITSTRSSDQAPPRDQSLRHTRARRVQQVGINSEEPSPVKREPRVQGAKWENSLTYPATGPKKQTVEWDDLKRLEDEELLNDNIVGLFLRYLQENAREEDSKQIHMMSTFFYESLMRPTDPKSSRKQINYAAVSKWTKSVDIFRRRFVVVPINENLHWYTLLICNLEALTDEKPERNDDDTSEVEEIIEGRTAPGGFPSAIDKQILTTDLKNGQLQDDIDHDSDYEKSKVIKRGPKKKPVRAQRKYDTTEPVIITLDSLDTGGRSSTASMLKDYIIEEGNQKRSIAIDKANIKGMTAKGIPHQGNFSDCGLYVCLYLEQFMANPSQFANAILRREDSIINWPRRLSSSKMRRRLYEFLQALYEAQETGQSPTVPQIGHILIRDEDHIQSERKRIPRARQPDGLDLDRLQQGLQYANGYFEGLSHDVPSERDNTQRVRDESSEGMTNMMNSIKEFVDHDNAVVDVEDDLEQTETRSPYFPEQALPKSNYRSQHKGCSSPQELAKSLRHRRESLSKSRPTRDVIDLSSPVNRQEVDDDWKRRDCSVSTDFLTSDDSYDQNSPGQTSSTLVNGHAILHIQPEKAVRETITIDDSQSAERQQGLSAMIVLDDSQPDRKSERHARKMRRSPEEEGYDHGEQIYARTLSERDVSVVPESLPSTQVLHPSKEVRSRPHPHAGSDEMLLK